MCWGWNDPGAPETGAAAEVVHFAPQRHASVLNPSCLSVICQGAALIYSNNNTLQISLKIGQLGETGRIQGKFAARRMFCPELSTETVDSFPLAERLASVQPEPGIVG
jgi:hypothetical protein